jgi:hypothetical protein
LGWWKYSAVERIFLINYPTNFDDDPEPWQKDSMTENEVAAYWWDGSAWRVIDWAIWEASILADGSLPLPTGEHHAVVLVIDDDGSIANIAPHRFIVDKVGKRHAGCDPISAEDDQFYRAIMLKKDATEAELHRYHEISEKHWRWALPSPLAVRALLQALPGLPSNNHERGIWAFLAAYGSTSPSAGKLQ